jgi:thioredoxin-dependent peroxiredoxin
MIAEGRPAPKFSLPDQDGKPMRLSSFRGRPVILYFYPQDDTPTCTQQACEFRDAHEKLGDAVVLGISPDTVAAHRKFATKHAVPFTLLADPERKVIEAYGVWKEKTMWGRTYMGVERTTIVIDRKGVVRRIFPRVRLRGHMAAVLAALAELSP